ncbi:hypothetical protein LOC68_27450 [Blastopirellula sp. JC732]|uniref:Uncharacterized protein n=1 Tax=Blastopirellula sediminis TaxID=2894196 RepID=A0A9X1MRD7_9BACT|nr:hypothetical protein [Blastopirellula sediminis]MCC9604553.1 hypothetical protein [Blastopirellula sediminis]MCC9632148.1 hypothetical protein [Blastopirellula sediminis]
MKSQSLVARIKKEVQKSPQKAAVLAGLFLVALWFWAPLVKKWLPASKSRPAPSDVAIEQPLAATPQPQASSAGNEMNWRTWSKRMKENPRMKSAELPKGSLDPFRKIQVAAAEDPKENVAAPVAEVKPTPDDLFVRSVIVGRTRAIARINQANYEVGDVVQTAQGVSFVISAIEPNGVILARDGETFDLHLKTYDVNESDKTLVLRQGTLQP